MLFFARWIIRFPLNKTFLPCWLRKFLNILYLKKHEKPLQHLCEKYILISSYEDGHFVNCRIFMKFAYIRYTSKRLVSPQRTMSDDVEISYLLYREIIYVPFKTGSSLFSALCPVYSDKLPTGLFCPVLWISPVFIPFITRN